MSRVRLMEKSQASPEVKEVYDKIERNGAEVFNLYKVLAHNPIVMRDFLKLGNSLLAKADLSPKLRELAILRVASLAGSKYEWTQHYHIALETGVSSEQIEMISHWKDSVSFSDEERAVLQYTDEVAQNIEVKDETYRALMQHLDEQRIVELTLSIGYWGMVARVLVPLQVEIDIQPLGSAESLTGYKR